VWSHRSAAAFALRNSIATDAAQAGDISPFFAALAAILTACFSALMPFRISLLALCLPLVPAAREMSRWALLSRCPSAAGRLSPEQMGCARAISMAHPLVHAPAQVGP